MYKLYNTTQKTPQLPKLAQNNPVPYNHKENTETGNIQHLNITMYRTKRNKNRLNN